MNNAATTSCFSAVNKELGSAAPHHARHLQLKQTFSLRAPRVATGGDLYKVTPGTLNQDRYSLGRRWHGDAPHVHRSLTDRLPSVGLGTALGHPNLCRNCNIPNGETIVLLKPA